MLEINDTDLLFAFPEVDDRAILRVHFSPVDSPVQFIRLDRSTDETIRLAAEGRFVMYLQPNYSSVPRYRNWPCAERRAIDETFFATIASYL